MIKKTYIPGKPRNPKLGTATGTSGVGKTEFNQVAGSSHEHYNKGVLDQITEAMLVGALRDLITSTDTDSELTDENTLSSLRVLLEITKSNETFLEDLKKRFLSKIETDTAQKLIKFVEGLEVGTFTTGALGAGAAIKMIDGISFAEVDNLTVRQKATFRELIIESLKHIGGQLVLTPARMECVRVVEEDTFYKCYFDTGDGEVSNEFVAGDFARCQVFTGSGVKFYWRLVTLVGEDWINLSKTSAVVGSDAPEAGDDIVQLGNATDTTRQSAIILSTVGIDAPSWKQYSGINSLSLEGKETTVFSKLGNKIYGETVFTSGGANLDDHLDGVAQDILDALRAAQDAEDKAQQAIEDAEANVATINTEVGKLQDQLDGKVSNWFYDYTPTLSNYPASDWDTTLLKDSHIGDTFTNTAPAPAENAGKSWRFVKNGSTYSWTVIADSDAVKALLEASKAQATADGKSTTHLFQPTKYKLGDMWVLNADQTVNGIVYKQGDLLTATQDSETFVQAHWLKRVRYTDDTKIDNLEIGGRNYQRNIGIEYSASNASVVASENKLSIDFDTTKGSSAYVFLRVLDNLKSKSGEEITTQLKITNKNSEIVYLRYGVRSIADDVASFSISANSTKKITNTQKTTADSVVTTRIIIYAPVSGNPSSVNVDIEEVGVHKGNKSADWTPAPEDVQAEIDGIEIGGRNLILNSTEDTKGYSGNPTYLWSRLFLLSEKLVVGQKYTFSIGNIEGAEFDYISLRDSSNGKNDVRGIVGFTPNREDLDRLYVYYKNYPESGNVTVSNIKLEKGNKATDWTPAPEDVQAEISDAKQVGLDAQNDLNTTKTTVNSLNAEWGEATQDGIIDDAERKAIGTTKKSVNESMAKVDATYNKLYNNQYLKDTLPHSKPKSNLKDARDAIWEKKEALFTRIDAVLDKTKNFETEKGLADTAFGVFDTHMGLYQKAVEDASESIQKALDKLSSDRVDDIEIGGRNLIILRDSFENRAMTVGSGGGSAFTETGSLLTNYISVKSGDKIIRSHAYSQIAFYNKDKEPLGMSLSNIGTIPANQNSLPLQPPVIPADKVIEFMRVAFRNNFLDGKSKYEIKVKIEKGTKATDWTPAPEDTEREILESQGYMKARYIRAWAKGNSVNNRNDWNEIKVINKQGVNIAKLKWVTGNGTISGGLRATDEDIYNTTYAVDITTPATHNYLELDLLQVHYDIDYIQIWHYWQDGRTYYGTKTEISEDGITWKTIFDSAVEGTYAETAEGKIHTTKLIDRVDKVTQEAKDAAAKAQALEYLKLAIGEDPIINGALFTLVTILLKERMDADVTAGVSGLQGVAKNLPAFWAGGTDLQAQQGTAKAIIRHDGTVKFTDAEITGEINATSGNFKGNIDALTGTLGNLTMKSGGAIYLPPTYSSQKGRLDNSGLALIYAGDNSQKIEWYSGLGTIAGQITTTSGGELKLLSSFGVRIGTDLIGDAISIAKPVGAFHHEIDLNTSELKNIRKLSTVGQINMAYTSHALSANTNYHLETDTALIVLTSVGSGAGIYRITGTGNSNPSNGDVKIVTNANPGVGTVFLMATKPSTATYASNIKTPAYDGNDFNLHENSSIMLVYYGGYWRVQTDNGQ